MGPVAAPPQLPVAVCSTAWLLKKDVALLPTILLLVTLVAPMELASLYKPPPSIVAQLFRMQLPVTVVLPAPPMALPFRTASVPQLKMPLPVPPRRSAFPLGAVHHCGGTGDKPKPTPAPG